MGSILRLLLGASVAGTLLGVANAQAPSAVATSSVDEPAAAAPKVAAPPREAAAPTAEVIELRADLERIVQSGGQRSAQHGVLVVSLDRGDTLFALNPDLPLAPASNMKLYSTAAALYYLGPEFRYSTYLLGDGPVREGVLQGDLILYGTGDPTISRRMLQSSQAVFRAFADSLAAQGVREVQGAVVGDGSYFDDTWVPEGWGDNRMASYGAPVGALSFAENVVSVRVLPGGGAGQPARISTTPSTVGLAVDNQVRTVGRGSTSIRFEHGADRLVVRGQIARGHPGVARSVPVVDPGNFAAAAFHVVLKERGIEVRGGVRGVRDPDSSRVAFAAAGPAEGTPPRVLAVHLSPALEEIATITNHISQNLFADALLKTVGRVALGDGSFAGGARAVQYFLECEGRADGGGLAIVDGSGLSRLNRVTARSTVQLLDVMARGSAFHTYLATLPLAGTPTGSDHSLRNRMVRTAGQGKVWAKTGTISRVSSLSGYVTAVNGERLAFSILTNEAPSTWQAKRVEDRLAIRLASFTRPGRDAAPMGEAEAEPAPTPPSGPVPAPAPSAATPVSSAPAPSTPAAARTYRVRRGDTLDEIARRNGTTVAAIQRLNPGVTPRRLQIGQRITLPD